MNSTLTKKSTCWPQRSGDNDSAVLLARSGSATGGLLEKRVKNCVGSRHSLGGIVASGGAAGDPRHHCVGPLALPVIGSRVAQPVTNDFRITTSVVVPSYREDPELLLRALASWLAENPTEVIVVLDVDDVECQVRLALVRDPRLRTIVMRHEGKRSALGVGIRASMGEVVVLSDSDTMWTTGLLAAVQMPFVDPEVGAVGTQQNVYQPSTSVWRRIADWTVNLRYLDYVPAMGRKGGVICLSGRTAAYRRSAIMPVLSNLEHEFFLGRRCVAGDDGRLTWLVLASG